MVALLGLSPNFASSQGTTSVQSAADSIRFKAEAQATIEAHFSSLETLYKDIHAAPELAFQEVKTAARLAAEMGALGFEVTEKIGKTGIVAILKNGPDPTSA